MKKMTEVSMNIKCPHCGKEVELTTSEAAATLGRKGGKAKSEAKTAANREKGKKYGHLGGRPKGSKNKPKKEEGE